jgi:type I restriction enzyme S subunit
MKEPPGVITGRYGTIGKVFYSDQPYWPLNTTLYVTDFRGNDSRFIYYFLKSFDFEKFSDKSTVPGINRNHLHTEIVRIPPISEQTAIASVLSSLDDKIDLLHRQNATLEKMAETLFRQWFVEEAKEEWEEGTLDDILTVKGGTTPSTSEPAYWNGSIHWTSPRDITDLNGIFLFDTERKITELGLSKISSGLLPKGTLLMSSRAPVGVLAFAEVPIAINQGYIAILDDKGVTKEFIYLWLKSNIEIVHSFSNGSTFMEISKSAFKTIQLQIPPKEVLRDFQIIVKPLFEKIRFNQIQMGTLKNLRDSLLPKLMSGEVRVETQN